MIEYDILVSIALGGDRLSVVFSSIVHLNRRADHVTMNLIRVALDSRDVGTSNGAWQRIRGRSGDGPGSGPRSRSIARLLGSVRSFSVSTFGEPGALRLEDFAFGFATRSSFWLVSFALFFSSFPVLPLEILSSLDGTSFLVLLSSGIVAFLGSVWTERATWSDSNGSSGSGSGPGGAFVPAVPLSILPDRSVALD